MPRTVLLLAAASAVIALPLAAQTDLAASYPNRGVRVVVTVPALRWLWSDWDVALHHRRRYHRADLLRLVGRCGVEVLHCSYINTLALLPRGTM